MRPPKVVNISVNCLTGTVNIRPYWVHIGVRAQDEVVWRCEQGTVKIHFPGKSPFADPRKVYFCPEGGSVASGPAVVEGSRRKRDYRYHVQVEIARPGPAKRGQPRVARYGRDPEVIVDPEPA
jgi:hypothetical protein